MSQQLREHAQTMYPEEEFVRRRLCEAIDGLTNAAAARLLGVSHETIRRIRIGDPPSLRVVIAACKVLGIEPRWLVLGESGPKYADPQ